MSCKTWQESLTEKLYGEIGDEDDARLTVHLESCANCRDSLDAFQRVRSLMREDDNDVRRVPRVVVLRDRFRFRPALMAASLLGTVVLAGLGAGAGYALGSGRAPASDGSTQVQAAASVAELVRREVDRRMAALPAPQTDVARSKAGDTVATPATERPVNASEFRAELAKFERRLNGTRTADLDYVLDQIAASEFRVGTRLGKTNQALRSVALANSPFANEQ
jgi:Putative zinc-finger